RSNYGWDPARRGIARLLTEFGPLELLRVEAPCDGDGWVQFVGREMYRAAKIVAPHVLFEFVSSDMSVDGRGESGLQRIGSLRRESAGSSWSEELWPTDVVVDIDHGPLMSTGIVGRGPRPVLPPMGDGPWRIVDGRRHYVPLQLELALGDFTPRGSIPTADSSVQDFGTELRHSTTRARNVLIIVVVAPDGRLSPESIAQLHELGKR
ncbi:MAG TPA: hypothetical protein VFG37_00705, partial [Planctomycetota bacterium]|nr:hypothetical protein [Planctomycetota bacterium]